MSSDLRTCFRFHRLAGRNAATALDLARRDVALGIARSDDSAINPWKAGGEDPERFILYRAVPSNRWRDVTDLGHSGHYIDESPDGTIYPDLGMLRAVVLRLPARKGVPVFLAAYERVDHQGREEEEGAVVDLSTVYDDGRHAASAADELARIAAEHERAYQAAATARTFFDADAEEIVAERRIILQALAERRGFAITAAPALCGMVRAAVKQGRANIARARARRADLFERFAGMQGWIDMNPEEG